MLNPVLYAKSKAMFGLSGGHLLIVAVVVLLFGGKRLPELGSALGRGMHAFKKGLEGKTDDEDEKDKIASDDHNGPKRPS